MCVCVCLSVDLLTYLNLPFRVNAKVNAIYLYLINQKYFKLIENMYLIKINIKNVVSDIFLYFMFRFSVIEIGDFS